MNQSDRVNRVKEIDQRLQEIEQELAGTNTSNAVQQLTKLSADLLKNKTGEAKRINIKTKKGTVSIDPQEIITDILAANKRYAVFVVCSLTGFFGVHRYLLGYKNWWIQLLTFGCLGMWWIVDLVRIGIHQFPKADGTPLEKGPHDKQVIGAMVVVLLIIGFIGNVTSPTTSSRSSSSSSHSASKRYEINKFKAKSLLRGCCTGAGGHWSSNDYCLGNPKEAAFIKCAGDGNTYIRYENGNVIKLDPYKYLP